MRVRRLIHANFDLIKDDIRRTFVYYASAAKSIEFDMREVLQGFDLVQPSPEGPISNLNALVLRDLDNSKMEVPWMAQSMSSPLVDLLGYSMTFETSNRVVESE